MFCHHTLDLDGVRRNDFQLHAIPFPHLFDNLVSFIRQASSVESDNTDPGVEARGNIEQDHAFMLMAVGSALGFWRVVTPEVLRLDGEIAERAARAGYIMITGYRREGREEEAA